MNLLATCAVSVAVLPTKLVKFASLVAFGAASYRHGIMMSSLWNEVRVDGVSAQDQLLSWINDGVRTEVMSTCDGVNCQDTCPYIDIGDNALC